MEVKSHYQQAKCGRFSELLLIKIRSTVLINSIEVLRRVEKSITKFLNNCDDMILNTLKYTTQYFANPVESQVHAYS